MVVEGEGLEEAEDEADTGEVMSTVSKAVSAMDMVHLEVEDEVHPEVAGE